MDEANSSDSEETFVYESNPPEPVSRTHRFHSRTPSATSMASQVDHFAGRYRPDGHNSIVGKKSMKFINNAHLNGYSGDGENATPPSASGRGAINGSHHHHIGRHGRATGHASILDNESPFPSAAKTPRSTASHSRRLSPRPLTPRSPHVLRIPGTGKSLGSNAYDLEGEGADDEQTPLIANTRSQRTRYSRRPATRDGDYYRPREQGALARVGACLLLGTLVSLLIAVIVLSLILCSKTLTNVHIREIDHVIASDQEIMFDLRVSAVNPNLIPIQVSDLDILVHAKSKYVGTSKLWREHNREPHNQTPSGSDHDQGKDDFRTWDNVDEGTDPIEDPDGDPHMMTLGQILSFDSPLTFDASPWKHESGISTGGVRLSKPGNRTEEGGSDRWETVIQHPFELVVQGVIKYTLPISSRVRSASVGGRILVKPEAPVDDGDDLFAD